jgi:hypothetical protein
MSRASLLIGIVLLIASAALALGLRSNLERREWNDPSERRMAGDEPLEARVDALLVELRAASESRLALSEEIEDLKARIAFMERDLQARYSAPAAAEGNMDVDTSAEEPSTSPTTPARGSEFRAEALVSVGFDPRDVDAYRDRLDEIELKRLYLRDQAARGGWLETPRYAQERRDLFGELTGTREEFGEDLYDWVLYTTGHPNRIRITEVIGGSAAAEAGLQAGDLIERYDDIRVLSTMELRELTSGGKPSATTALDVRRGDEQIRAYIPRGPLGVRLEPVVEQPPSPR